VGKTQRKRPLTVPGCRWEGNAKMDFREKKGGEVDYINLAQDKEQ
jgi:hypothetical protein